MFAIFLCYNTWLPSCDEGILWISALTHRRCLVYPYNLLMTLEPCHIVQIHFLRCQTSISLLKPQSSVSALPHLMILLLISQKPQSAMNSYQSVSSDSKESAFNAEDPGLIPESWEDPLEKEMATLLLYSCLEDPVDRPWSRRE